METYENSIEPKKVYSQVYSILTLMGNNYIDKIPKKLFMFIDNNRDKTYVPKYDSNSNFKEQNVNKKALSIICMIDLKYWCNESEKLMLTERLKQNQLILNQKNEVLYNNIFKKKEQNDIVEEIKEETTALMVQTKEKFLKRIINKILSFFRRKN